MLIQITSVRMNDPHYAKAEQLFDEHFVVYRPSDIQPHPTFRDWFSIKCFIHGTVPMNFQCVQFKQVKTEEELLCQN